MGLIAKNDERKSSNIAKLPPTYTVLPLTASFDTKLLGEGFQAFGVPLLASMAAMLLRVWLPMVIKPPPTYTVLPLAARVYTEPSTLGFQVVSAPLLASMAARRLRTWPSIVVKSPPTYSQHTIN